MSTLHELDARFVRHKVVIADKSHGRKLPDGTTQWGGFEVDAIATVATLQEAQGVWFDCPKCYQESVQRNEPGIGVHGVLIWFAGRGVPDRLGKNKDGQTVRWNVVETSTSLNDLSLTPSILQQSGCQWHGFVGSSGVPPGNAA
jgi:hypothetical protein